MVYVLLMQALYFLSLVLGLLEIFVFFELLSRLKI